MSAFTTLGRIAGATAVAATALCLSAGPSSAQSLNPGGSGSPATSVRTTTPSSGIDWTDVGSGALAGFVLAGGAVAATRTLRRSQQPTPA